MICAVTGYEPCHTSSTTMKSLKVDLAHDFLILTNQITNLRFWTLWKRPNYIFQYKLNMKRENAKLKYSRTGKYLVPSLHYFQHYFIGIKLNNMYWIEIKKEQQGNMITALHPPEGKRGGSSCKIIKKGVLLVVNTSCSQDLYFLLELIDRKVISIFKIRCHARVYWVAKNLRAFHQDAWQVVHIGGIVLPSILYEWITLVWPILIYMWTIFIYMWTIFIYIVN